MKSRSGDQKHASCTQSAFTLIELLVTVSIIAMLAGMLLPALGNARAKAREISCVNKIRQIGTASIAYREDFNEFPCTERWLDDFSPVYSYLNSLDVFV
ncbi:MAG: type II secretion system protein, partial [Victivallaceae bacterium]|nr:type II secretion system protein [Victivallaceae bacterium]